MSVLVTGGAGYIGSHAVLALLDAGRQVVVLDDLSTGVLSLVPESVPVFIGKSADQALVRDIVNKYSVTAIMHFSGSTIVPQSVTMPLRYYDNNTASSRSLIEAAIESGVNHFLFSSTAAVYGNPPRMPVSEEDATLPVSPYGRSKLMTEWMLQDASAAHPLRHVCLRYFNVAGADPKLRSGLSTPGATHVLKVAVEAAVGKRACFEVFGTDYPTPDGTCIRDFIHVSDLADAHVAALQYLELGGESTTLNCGYGRGYSVRQVLEAVTRVSGKKLPILHMERRPGDIDVSIAQTDRIRRVLSWSPRFDRLEIIAAHALAWEQRLKESQLISIVPNVSPVQVDRGRDELLETQKQPASQLR